MQNDLALKPKCRVRRFLQDQHVREKVRYVVQIPVSSCQHHISELGLMARELAGAESDSYELGSDTEQELCPFSLKNCKSGRSDFDRIREVVDLA